MTMSPQTTSRGAPLLERAVHVPLPAQIDAPARPAGRAKRWAMIGIAAVVMGGGAYVFQQKQARGAPSAASAERAVPVTVATVVKKDVQIWLEGLGTATPLATVNVKTLVDGPLVSVNFKEGQIVHKGDL